MWLWVIRPATSAPPPTAQERGTVAPLPSPYQEVCSCSFLFCLLCVIEKYMNWFLIKYQWHVYEMPTCESHVSLFTFISHAVGEEKIEEQLFVTSHRPFKKLWIWEELWFEYKGWHLMCPMKRHGIQELSMVEFWCSSSACVESRCFSCLMYWDGHYTSVTLKWPSSI